MLRTMITATNTMSQLQFRLNEIGNNLANNSTPAFKATDVQFNEMLYQQINNDKDDRAARQTPPGLRYSVGAMVGKVGLTHSVGVMQNTPRQLDFAFDKEKQFFNIIVPDGENGEQTIYTRRGDFYLSLIDNETFMLVNSEGYPVANSAGQTITIPVGASDYEVKERGVVLAKYPNGNEVRIELAVTKLHKSQFIQQISGSNYALPPNLAELGYNEAEIVTDLQGADRQQIELSNNKLEMSNVEIVKESTNLISTQRAYQFNARTITLADQMLGLINGIR